MKAKLDPKIHKIRTKQGLKHKFITKERVFTLFWKIDISKALVSSFFIELLIAFVLRKSIQSNRKIPFCFCIIFGKSHHLLRNSFALNFWMNSKAVDINIFIFCEPFYRIIFCILEGCYSDASHTNSVLLKDIQLLTSDVIFKSVSVGVVFVPLENSLMNHVFCTGLCDFHNGIYVKNSSFSDHI